MVATHTASANEAQPPLLAAIQLAKTILPSATHNEYVLLGHFWCGQAFLTQTSQHTLSLADLLDLLTSPENTAMVPELSALSDTMTAAKEWLPGSKTTAWAIEQTAKGIATLSPWDVGSQARIGLYSIVMGDYEKVHEAYSAGIYNQIVSPVSQRNLFLIQVFNSISRLLACETAQEMQIEAKAFIEGINKYFDTKQLEYQKLTVTDVANVLDYFRAVTDTSGTRESWPSNIIQRFADTLRTPHNELLWQINRPSAHHRPFLLESSAQFFAKNGNSHIVSSTAAETMLLKTPLQFV